MRFASIPVGLGKQPEGKSKCHFRGPNTKRRKVEEAKILDADYSTALLVQRKINKALGIKRARALFSFFSLMKQSIRRHGGDSRGVWEIPAGMCGLLSAFHTVIDGATRFRRWARSTQTHPSIAPEITQDDCTVIKRFQCNALCNFCVFPYLSPFFCFFFW